MLKLPTPLELARSMIARSEDLSRKSFEFKGCNHEADIENHERLMRKADEWYRKAEALTKKHNLNPKNVGL